MSIYEVGKLYHPARTAWPEATQYNYIAGEHHLHAFMRGPVAQEVRAYRDGEASFALVVDGPLIVLCWRFAPLAWADAPFSIHRVPHAQRTIPPADPLADGAGALLTTMLIDAGTGIIRAIRAIGLGTDLSNALHRAIRAQAAQAWDGAAYDDALNRLYARYPSTDLLAAAASVRWPVPPPRPPRPPRGKMR